MQQTWIIVGATSAIARAYARRLADDGAGLILAGRDQAERREDVHGGQPMESTGTYRKSRTSFTLARSTGVALSYEVQGYGGRHAHRW